MQIISITIFGLQVALLVSVIKEPITKVAVPAVALELICVLVLVILVIFEYQRMIRPPTYVSLYLVSTVTSGPVQIRTLFIRGYAPDQAAILTSSLVCRVLLLVFESWSKKPYLISTRDHSPEELAGIFSRTTFFWLNPILLRGNKKVLTIDDLYPLDHELHSNVLQHRISAAWEKRTLTVDWRQQR